MLRFLPLCFVAAAAIAKEPVYEFIGRIEPPARASITIFGAVTPFSEAAVCDGSGRFRFRKLLPGAYTLAIYVSGRGEARMTVDVGPSSAGSKHRVVVTLNLKDSDFTTADITKQNAVTTRELSIPARARQEYEDSRKDLARRDVESAISHLNKCVALAPQFAAAWNTLGTIAYQTQKFERAAQYFRRALTEDPHSYEALVNLGGVLINLRNLDDARTYNERAISMRPNDALANSQLGMTYFELDNLEPAEKYLTRAVEIDPAHFSHPQLMLAEIHIRKKQFEQAAADLQNFLSHHPDWPQGAELRATILKLRQTTGAR